MDRPMMASIDDDSLQLVFEEFAHGEPWKWPDAVYDVDVARRPFLLASVSRRWRSLALANTSLWTYFGFPEDVETHPKHTERLRLLIAASKNALVDIIVTFDFNFSEGFNTFHPADSGAKIIKILGHIGPRWRHVRLHLPRDAIDLLRPALEGPLPNLASLSATISTPWTFLPSAPRLEQLYIDCDAPEDSDDSLVDSDDDEHFATNIESFSNLSSPEKLFAKPDYYPALSSLTASGEFLVDTLCRQNFDTLTELCLIGRMDPLPTERLQISCLTSLHVEDARILSYIDAPSLTRLGICGSGVFTRLQSLSSFAAVETLVLYGKTGGFLPSVLWDLSGIQFLIFHEPVPLLRSFRSGSAFEYFISRPFFRSLNEDERGLTWPQLRRIWFRRPRSGMDVVLDEVDLLQFVKKRNAKRASSQRPVKVREIIVEQPSNLIHPDTAKKLAKLTALRNECGPL